VVLPDSCGVTVTEVEVTDPSYAIDEKFEYLETWTRYEVAPVEAFHVRVGVRNTFCALFAGEINVGADGALPLDAAVVKLQTVDQALVPAELVAFTRQ
jgi:hypothetical protein